MPLSPYKSPLLYKNLTEAHYNEIRSMYYQGATLVEIRDAFSISARTLRQALADMNIQTQRKNRYTLNENYFAVIDSPNKAYLLGLLAADGCITDTNYLAIQLTDKGLLDFFIQEIELSLLPRLVQKYVADGYERQDMYRVNFSCAAMVKHLQNYGFAFAKSLNFDYMLEGEYQWAFVLGYFDGDGHVSAKAINKHKKSHKGFMSIVGTESFCNKVRNILECGRVYVHTSKPVWYWSTSSRFDILKFYQYAYQGGSTELGLLRKRNLVELLANEVV